MLLVQSFHANQLTENENVIASSAQDCYVIVLDFNNVANNDTADTFSNEISIPAQPKFPISNPKARNLFTTLFLKKKQFLS